MNDWDKWEEDLTASGFWFIYICICLGCLVGIWALFAWVLK